MTRTRAGRTPAKRALGPSSWRRVRRVARVLELFCGEEWGTGAGREDASLEEVDEEEEEDSRAVMRVLTTQIGFVMRTVAEPARAPASMDSSVVSLVLVREGERWAARSKKARVHSYPGV